MPVDGEIRSENMSEDVTAPISRALPAQQNQGQGLYSNIPMPPKMEMAGSLAENWRRWRQIWDSFEIISNLRNCDNTYRVATFITCIGTEALDVYNGLPFETEEDKKDMEKILDLMETYCIGELNVIYERYVFNNRNQATDETIDAYTSALRTMASTCQFGVLKEELIRDRIVCGIRENTTRKKLLQESNKLDLRKAIDICRSSESTTAKIKAMTSNKEADVHVVRKMHVPQKKPPPRDKERKTNPQMVDCKFCGQHHEKSKHKCPAYGRYCSKCGKPNHFAKKCKTGNHSGGARKGPKKSVHQIEEDYDSECDSSASEVLTVHQVNNVQLQTKIFATMLIAGKPVKFQIDSGATCNLLPARFAPQGIKVEAEDKPLNMYNGAQMKTQGKCQVKVVNPKNGKKYKVHFILVDEHAVPILGSRAAQQMTLVKVQYENIAAVSSEKTELTMEKIMENFNDVFKGQGCLPGKLHLETDPEVTLTKMPLRRIPVAMKSASHRRCAARAWRRQIQEATRKDDTMQSLKEVIIKGWPDNRSELTPDVSPYFHIRDEMSVQNGIIFRGSRCVIPRTLRSSILCRLHSSHLGVEGCLRRARECIHWPGMNAEVKDFISKCETCQKFEASNCKETLMSHDVPERPWQKVGTDLFTLDDNNYLITVDYYSNFWEIDALRKDTTAKSVIKKLKAHFARYGCPDQVVSDNGPQFACDEFAKFAVEWDFDHTPSSPAHSKSNGKAESAVKTAKKLLRKAKDAKTDPYLAILDCRNTPTQGIDSSPAQRLMNRRTKTLLPMVGELLKPRNVQRLG